MILHTIILVFLNFKGKFVLLICVQLQVYPTMRFAFLDIIRTRGVQGLYAGLSPTLVEIVPYAGLQFGTYDIFKRWTLVSSTCSMEIIVSCYLLELEVG